MRILVDVALVSWFVGKKSCNNTSVYVVFKKLSEQVNFLCLMFDYASVNLLHN